jgi:acyl-CoA synthetase (AMP-forming)/AMP-acid ligase II
MRTDPILDAFDRLTQRDGSAALVATRGGTACRSHVASWAQAASSSLADCGAIPGSYALVSCVNGAGFLAAVIGARRAGLVPVLADWASPPAELDRVAESLGVAARISCGDVFPRETTSIRVTPERRAPTPALPGAGFVKLTSGSSGTPSGVAIASEALAADDDQLASAMGLSASDRFVGAIPWSHSYGLSSLVMPALRRGSVLVLPDDSSPWAAIEAASAFDATVIPTVPVYLQTLVGLSVPPRWPESLRTVISAGAPLSGETSARFAERFGRRAHVFYGASECGGICYDRDGGAAERGTVGAPIDGVDVSLDADGRVVVRGPALALARVPEPDDRLGEGAFESADLGAWTGRGELTLLGRADGLINVGGKKVHPAEVESVLRTMPGVSDAVVVGVAATGDERAIVRAFVACDPERVSYADVATWCRARLAGHKVPRSIIRLADLPRTSRGKIDRAALASLDPVER